MRDVTFKVVSLGGYILSVAMLPLLETFMELCFLIKPSVLLSHFLNIFDVQKFFISSGGTSILKRARSHWEPNLVNEDSVPAQ
jgi:hypothetical protein